MEEHASFEPQAVLTPRRRHGNTLAALGAGLAVLAIVGAGALGGLASKPTPSTAVAAIAEESAALPIATPSPGPTGAPPPVYPRSVLGLQVWSAAYVSTYGFGYFPASFAVAGWYVPQRGTACPTPRVDDDPSLADEFGVSADGDAFCQRVGSLFTAPLYDENVAPIEIELRPGVPAPASLKDIATVTPVVFVGTLTNPGGTCHALGTCPSHMVVDRVAWAGGIGQAQTTSVLPRLLDRWPPLGAQSRDDLAARAIGRPGAVLLETLVDPATLRRIDPEAAQVVAAAAPRADRIWYRRTLGREPDDAIRWVAIDDATGEIIASGLVVG